MISVYSGRPGAGKSYASVVQVLGALQVGRRVVTNLPLDVRGIRVYFWRRGFRSRAGSFYRPGVDHHRVERSKEDLKRIRGILWRRLLRGCSGRGDRFLAPAILPPGALTLVDTSFFHRGANWRLAFDPVPGMRLTAATGSVVVVDEAGSVFDSYDFGTNIKANMAALLKSLQEHRHFYASVILIVQSHHQLDSVKRIKALVGRWCEIANLRHGLGIGRYVRRTYEVHYGANRQCLHAVQGAYKREIFSCYRSHSQAGPVVDETGIERDVAAGKTGRGKLVTALTILVVALLVLLFLVWQARSGLIGDLLPWGSDPFEHRAAQVGLGAAEPEPVEPEPEVSGVAPAPAAVELLLPPQRWPKLSWLELDHYVEQSGRAVSRGRFVSVADCTVVYSEGRFWRGCAP